MRWALLFLLSGCDAPAQEPPPEEENPEAPELELPELPEAAPELEDACTGDESAEDHYSHIVQEQVQQQEQLQEAREEVDSLLRFLHDKKNAREIEQPVWCCGWTSQPSMEEYEKPGAPESFLGPACACPVPEPEPVLQEVQEPFGELIWVPSRSSH